MATLSVDGISAQAWERRERAGVSPTARIVGRTSAMQRIRELIAAVAGNHSAVLITGESGAGKELVARTIHDMSDRSARPFVAINCGALGDSLLDIQLFGGGRRSPGGPTMGVFAAADGRTVFLDEITEMSPPLQVRLVRFIEEREITPVGHPQPVTPDVRIIAASKDKPGRNGCKSLREDLYYHLSVVQLEIPSLRDRREDIPLLVGHFNTLHAMAYGQRELTVPSNVLGKLVNYPWPGNVRELSSVVERWYALGGKPGFDPAHIPPAAGSNGAAENRAGSQSRPVPTWEEAECELIERALRFSKGSKVGAARLLKIERHRLYRKIKKYKISGTN